MEVREYVVCYFDLLGQRDGLLKRVRNEKITDDLQKEIDSVSNLIVSFNESLLNAFNLVKEQGEVLLRLWGVPEKEMPPYLERMKQVHMGIQQYSDSTLFYAGAKDGDGMGFGLFVSYCLYFAMYYLQLIAQGIPLRGSIVMGKGWELSTNCLYGPVMEDAYFLESTIASFPRIVVDQKVIQCVRELDKEAELQHSSMRFSGCFCKDFDGLYILDYLSQTTIERLEMVGVDRHTVLNALVHGLQSIRITLTDFRKEAAIDSRYAIKARKYALLQSYWMQRTEPLGKYFDTKPIQTENLRALSSLPPTQ